MARAPYQVLVIPYRFQSSDLLVAVFSRSGGSIWQFIAGGGEDHEDPLSAAKREAHEEADIQDGSWLALDSKASIPRCHFAGTEHWPPDLFVVPEHAFAVAVESNAFVISGEHDQYKWVSMSVAPRMLEYDSNRVALRELAQRLKTELNKAMEPAQVSGSVRADA
jgi:dATP pyrophosphohydrolase